MSRQPRSSNALKSLGLLAQAAGMSFIAGLAILLLGTPIALAVRAVIEVVDWLIAAA